MIARTIAATTHGRYLVEDPQGGQEPGSARLLVGFHGYAEDAEAQLDRLRMIPQAKAWTLVSIQGLHRFYQRRTSRVVASWMTRQDRELLIADNLEYVDRVIADVLRGLASPDMAGSHPMVVHVGFSQGVAMAYRAACQLDRRTSAVVGFGGDVPPELDSVDLARVPAAIVGRGTRDDLYAPAVCASDERRLREAGVAVQAITVDAGHEWTQEFSGVVGQLLEGLSPGS